jgi:Iap family predicted aminopeptidase
MSKDQIRAADAMVNMDTLGLGPTMVWGSHADKQLFGTLIYVAQKMQAPLGRVDVDQVGSTDSVQFAQRNIPSITIHSLTQQTWNARILHTSRDRMSAIRMDDYYASYGLISAYLSFLDGVPRNAGGQEP